VGSRASKPSSYLKPGDITEEKLVKIRALNEMALKRGQKLSQMALTWVLRERAITSVLIGASRPQQIEEAVAALDHLEFSAEELAEIERILKD
ncbi:MAG: L-glyceraldehyde 3-phosphate reductase, partial [Anaerolineaceae bacterium]|nr:L-glyceraldehyde 3-phosphate reductase [Anaerolineaceae bacterium]